MSMSSDDYARALQRGLAPFVEALVEYNRNNQAKCEQKPEPTILPSSGSSGITIIDTTGDSDKKK